MEAFFRRRPLRIMGARGATSGRYSLLRRMALLAGLALALFSSVSAASQAQAFPATGWQAAVLGSNWATRATPPFLLRVGACQPSCPDCKDCVTEIDITPGPYPNPHDPIGHKIKQLEPSPLLASDKCAAGHDGYGHQNAYPDGGSCGIRCWYWRLRYGYCGPGCEYYRYRLGRPDGFPFPPYQQRYACGS
jgi:hypothetical protein